MSELCLATQRVDRGERVEYWREAMRTALAAECRIEPLEPDFDAAMRVLACGVTELVAIEGRAYRTLRRGPSRAGWVSLVFQTRGVSIFADRGRRVELAPGDACIVPPDRDIVVDRVTSFAQVLFNVPRHELDACLPDWAQHLLNRIPAESAPASAVAGLLRFVVAHHRQLGASDRDRLGATALHLVEGLRRAPAKPAGDTAGQGRLADFHRRRIESWLRAHLRDRDLCIAQLAADLGLSARYVHKLYAGREHGVMGWVREQRLEACRREIAARGARRIADIAIGWGFESPAHFSRAFRKRFGVPPSSL